MDAALAAKAAPAPRDGGPAARLRARLAFLSPWGPPLDPAAFPKPKRRVPGVAGTFAATTALLVALVLRFQGLVVFLPETAVEWVVDHIPGGLEASAIGVMGGYAKVLAVAVAIFAFIGVHSYFALYYPRAQAILRDRWKVLVLFATAPALATLFVVLPLFGRGIAGAGLPGGPGMAVASAVVSSATFSAALDFAYREFSRSSPDGIDLTRRTAIQGALIFLLAAAVGGALIGRFVTRVGRLSHGTILELMNLEVTPNADFYVVQKNLSSPVVNPSTWALSIDGLVDRPVSFSSNELLARPLTEEYVTLECVSNEVGGNLISNARWAGVPLAGLLAEAGVQPSASWVLFTAEDDYTVAVPLARASGPGAMVALNMNGERLPRDHGFPARVLVPGLYGMMNAKWVKRITLVDHEVLGFWQTKGWSNDARIRTQAIIAVAPSSTPSGQPVTLGGVAFAGDREISRVEVSTDGGLSWALAEVHAPLSPYAWTLWTFDWTPASPGSVRVFARAWERQGLVEVVQEPGPASPFPNGAAGYDSMDVTVTG